MKSRFGWVLAVAPAVSLLSDCRQVAGIDDRSADECASPAASMSFADEACRSCVTRSCCGELGGCAKDSACSSDFGCQIACSDETCRAACDKNARFTDKTAALVTCEVSHCADACGLGCGVRPLVAFGCDPVSSCRDVCCSDARARDGDPESGALRVCVDSCSATDADCVERCSNSFPLGADRSRRVDECMRESCGPKPPWECVGHVYWPSAKKVPFDIDFTLQEYGTGQPLDGLNVKGCQSTTPICDPPPFGTKQTDAQGTVTMSVKPPYNLPAYAGYFDISGTSQGGEYRLLHYFTPPWAEGGAYTFNIPSIAAATALAKLVGVELDPNRGHLFVELRGCQAAEVTRVSISADKADAASTTFYLKKNGIPDITLTESVGSATAGIVNLPPGPVEVTATANEICAPIGHVQVIVRAGTFTFTRVLPTP